MNEKAQGKAQVKEEIAQVEKEIVKLVVAQVNQIEESDGKFETNEENI
jgi:hypothetical protein